MNCRNESVCPLSGDPAETDGQPSDDCPDGGSSGGIYPFSLVMCLRVLQLVCGGMAMVTGSAGLIEKQDALYLAVSVTAGFATVLAVGV